jgi:pimeloyl-ACP methyl ester carboxylesterase
MNNHPNLILLHGALGSQQQLHPLMEVLKDQFNLYSYNLSGHGGKPVPLQFSISKFEEELIQFLDAHDLTAVNVFGYSMGGYIALQAAKKLSRENNQDHDIGHDAQMESRNCCE